MAAFLNDKANVCEGCTEDHTWLSMGQGGTELTTIYSSCGQAGWDIRPHPEIVDKQPNGSDSAVKETFVWKRTATG